MKNRPDQQRLLAQVPSILADLLGLAENELLLVRATAVGNSAARADLLVKALGKTFVVQGRMTTSAAAVAAAAKQVADLAGRRRGKAIPLLAVPFMGPVGRQICLETGVAWIDLSGNAHIVAPGLRISVAGRPNLFRSLGRPANVFAPKSARIARQLLLHPQAFQTQRALARATAMGEGFVSRIVARLQHDDYLIRNSAGAVRPNDPNVLLDAWRETYQFSKHTLLAGHVAARSGDGLLKFAGDLFTASGIQHAATGLAAAWQLTHFALFRLATIYLRDYPSPKLLERLGFREEARGANLWLVIPNDDGVFQGSAVQEGVWCVHPVQAYLDLKEQPERSSEAADQLRKHYLNWTLQK